MDRRLFSLALGLVVFSNSAVAAVIERDWLAPGDGLLTFDDVNQREWLDVSLTILTDFTGVPNGVLAELEPGGQFGGFQIADVDGVIALAESAGIDTGTLDASVNGLATAELIELLSWTHASRTWGLVDEFVDPSFAFPDQTVASFFSSPFSNVAGLSTFTYSGIGPGLDGLEATIIGVFLYRQIPEPTSLVLSTTGILLIGRRYRSLCASTIR